MKILLFIHFTKLVLFTGVTTVTVKPNNYDPYFIFNTYNAVINENATLGSNVLQIIAADNDTGAAGALHYNTLQGTDHDYFSIDERTGIIKNVKTLNSSSAPKVFFLRVSVRDHGTPVRHSIADANITIAVLRPSAQNNTITGVTALTMTVSLTKEPFLDSKIVKYQIVAQEYDPNINGCKLSSLKGLFHSTFLECAVCSSAVAIFMAHEMATTKASQETAGVKHAG